MAEKNNAKIGFEKQIWDAACVLWGHTLLLKMFCLKIMQARIWIKEYWEKWWIYSPMK